MNYKEVQANNGTVPIGYIGDNLATKVVFDVSDIQSTYGSEGTFQLLVKQQTTKGVNPYLYRGVYPAVIEQDMTKHEVVWIPTAEDTSMGQYMDVELVYVIDEQVVYNQMYRAVCKKSLANQPSTSKPEQAWVTKVLVAATNIEQLAQEVSGSATSARESAETASGAASRASESASGAAESALSAEQSAAQAKTAADSVTTATVAETKSYLGI